jgi:hypothetical protein
VARAEASGRVFSVWTDKLDYGVKEVQRLLKGRERYLSLNFELGAVESLGTPTRDIYPRPDVAAIDANAGGHRAPRCRITRAKTGANKMSKKKTYSCVCNVTFIASVQAGNFHEAVRKLQGTVSDNSVVEDMIESLEDQKRDGVYLTMTQNSAGNPEECSHEEASSRWRPD